MVEKRGKKGKIDSPFGVHYLVASIDRGPAVQDGRFTVPTPA